MDANGREFGRGATTPLGLLAAAAGFTQGSSCLATLGFGAESLWDSGAGFDGGMAARAGRGGAACNGGGQHVCLESLNLETCSR
jgi:hypothetical protein